MQFDSMADFLAMGGYGFYVWLSFGFTGMSLLAIVVQTILAQRTLKNQISAETQRRKRIQHAENKRTNHVSIPSVPDKAEK